MGRAGLAAGAEDAGGEDGHPEEEVADRDGDGAEDGYERDVHVYSRVVSLAVAAICRCVRNRWILLRRRLLCELASELRYGLPCYSRGAVRSWRGGEESPEGRISPSCPSDFCACGASLRSGASGATLFV